MRLYLATLATLALGCSSPSEGVEVKVDLQSAPAPAHEAPARVWSVVVDPNVPEEKLLVVEMALMAWTEAASCPTMFEVTRAHVEQGPLPTAGTVEVTMAEDLPIGPTGKPSMGWTSWDDPEGSRGSRILFFTGAPAWDFPREALHELGHAFRLEHDDAEPSVMGTGARETTSLTEADRANYEALWCR